MRRGQRDGQQGRQAGRQCWRAVHPQLTSLSRPALPYPACALLLLLPLLLLLQAFCAFVQRLSMLPPAEHQFSFHRLLNVPSEDGSTTRQFTGPRLAHTDIVMVRRPYPPLPAALLPHCSIPARSQPLSTTCLPAASPADPARAAVPPLCLGGGVLPGPLPAAPAAAGHPAAAAAPRALPLAHAPSPL